VHFDSEVAIVGAGPAGCAAAIWCASHGLPTLVLESCAFPRARPGETLHPGIEPLFDQLGVSAAVRAANFPRFEGIAVTWNKPLQFQPFGKDSHGPWQGFHARRAELDRILLRRASDAGAIILQPCVAKEITRRSARVTGLRSSWGDIRCRYLIDATGRTHFLQRELRLAPRYLSERLVVTYGYRKGRCDLGRCPRLTGSPRGWEWIAEVSPDLWAWVRLCFGSSSLMAPEPLSKLVDCGPARGADVTWRLLDLCAGDGYFVVGDAACVLDPGSSQGVLKAIMSGMMAADLILGQTRGIISANLAAEKFQAWMRERFEYDVNRLSSLYAELRSPAT
jgi:flavin-dependent dehydrogenase